MKIALVIIIGIHGLIHLLGFIKAFELATIKEFNTSIPKSQGIIWLIATILFLATAILLIYDNDYWELAAIVSVIISQVLVLLKWKDARWGTIPNILILLFAYSV